MRGGMPQYWLDRGTSHENCNTGLLLAEERLCEIQNFVLRFQQQMETIKDGFSVEYNNEQYDFTLSFIDRLHNILSFA